MRISTHRLVRPLCCLGFEFGTVSYLKGTAGAPRKEVGDLLPRETLVFLQVYEQLIILGRELEFGPPRPRCGFWHSLLSHNARGTSSQILVSTHQFRRRSRIWETVMMMGRVGRPSRSLGIRGTKRGLLHRIHVPLFEVRHAMD